MERSVEVSHLSKIYNGQSVVNDISFDISKGEVFGLIGPNGAGKTTIIRMLLDIIRPDSGDIRILNDTLSGELKNKIGYLPEERGLYKKLTVMETLLYLGALKNMNSKDRVSMFLDKMGMFSQKDKKISELILLVVSVYFILELSVRIFRASLLMYGKKPTIQELIKYVRQG